MTRQELTPSLYATLERKVLQYNVRDWDSAQWTLQAGIKNRTIPTTILKKWPTRVVVVMYDEESDLSQTKNPFWFRPLDLRDIVMDISGVKYGYQNLSWDVNNRNWNASRVYYQNAIASGALDDYPFEFHDFLEVYSIFLFDTTNTR